MLVPSGRFAREWIGLSDALPARHSPYRSLATALMHEIQASQAKTHLPRLLDAAALGKRVRESPKSEWREIVGVVHDEYYDGVQQKPPCAEPLPS
jgi:hypothetical protein